MGNFYCKKNFSSIFLTILVVFLQSPAFTLPHFNNSEAFFLFLVSSQCIEFSLLTAVFDIFFRERWTYPLTRTEVIKAAQSFKHSVAMRQKTIENKVVYFLLSASCMEALNFTISSCSLKITHDHVFKTTGLVLPCCEYTGFCIE